MNAITMLTDDHRDVKRLLRSEELRELGERMTERREAVERQAAGAR